jgi:predicted ferric reductase
MKRTLFYIWYIVWPLIPLYFYLNSLGFEFNQYTVSVALGVFAFVWLSNQFLLAAKPALLTSILGTKGLLSLHSTMPVIILVMAGLHRILKVAYGFNPDSFQAVFGGFAWWLYAIVIVCTLLLMANTKLMKVPFIKAFKDLVYAKTFLNYKRARLLHNITVLGAFALLVHMALASSSQFSQNPWGLSFLLLWMLFSLALYLRYRLRGRTA